MTENERLANECLIEIQRAMIAFLNNQWSAEQFVIRLKMILKILT